MKEYINPTGQIGDYLHVAADSITTFLRDGNKSTCISPLPGTRYIAHGDVQQHIKRHWVVAITGHNLSCGPHQGLVVYVIPLDKENCVDLCTPTPDIQEDGCSFLCDCPSGCFHIFINVFVSSFSDVWEICEVNV